MKIMLTCMLTLTVGIASAFVDGATEAIENTVESINVSGLIHDLPNGVEYAECPAPVDPSTLPNPDDPTSVNSNSLLTSFGTARIDEVPADWHFDWSYDILVYGNEVGSGQDFDVDEVTGDIYAVFDSYHATGDSCIVYRSQDGGSTWSFFGVGTNTDGSITNPTIRIARDGSGVSWVCMLAIWNEPTGDNTLWLRRWQTNGSGSTWEQVNLDVVWADMDADIGTGAWLYVTYCPDGSDNDIWAARNALGGAGWVDAQSLFDDPMITPYPEIAAGAGGTVAVAFCDDRVTTNNEVRIKRSTNNGSTWLNSAQVSNNSGAADLLQTGIAFDHAATQTGWITVTFDFTAGDNLGYYYSTDSGVSWNYGNIFAPTTGDENQSSIRALKVASGGAVTVAFNADPGDSTMFTWTSAGNPTNFITGTRINDFPATGIWPASAGWISSGGNYSAVMYCNIGPYNLYFDYYGNTGLEEGGSVAVSGIQSSPNPFSDLTSISFNLSQPSPVTLSVYSITGHLVATLAQGETLGSGNHTIQWQGQNQAGTPVSPGVYFCHLRADGIEKTHMMVRVR